MDISDPNYDWNEERNWSKRNTAAKKGILVPINSSRNERLLNMEHHLHFTIMKHKTINNETDKNIYDVIMCRVCKKTLKLGWNPGRKSYSTANINGHNCYKEIFTKKQEDEQERKDAEKDKIKETISSKVITNCRDIILDGVAKCIYKDIRPFSFTEGDGFAEIAKSLIKVGTILVTEPTPDILSKIIPGRNANTTRIAKLAKLNEERVRSHLETINNAICPAFHLSFDLWTDRGSKHHYLGVMAHEVDETKAEMKVYCLAMVDWEELVNHEITRDPAIDEEQYYDDGNAEDVRLADDWSEGESEGDDEGITFSDIDEDSDIDTELIDGASFEDEDESGSDKKENEDDAENSDNYNEVGVDAKVALKTSVTGVALQHNIDKLLDDYKLVKIKNNKHVHITGDRASNNVKAGSLMTITFTSGILHGMQNMVGASIKRLTSAQIRKKGSRKKVRNTKYRPKLTKILAQSRSFSKHVKRRGLNNNFKPAMKLVKEVRWNTLEDHLASYVVQKNWKRVAPIVLHWVKAKKFNKTESQHKYIELMGGEKLIGQLYKLLHSVKITFEYLEGERVPTIHRVLWAIDMLQNGGVVIRTKVNKKTQTEENCGERVESILNIKSNDESDVKAMKKLLKSNMQEKVLEHLLIVHWLAAMLCPALRDCSKNYLQKQGWKKYNSYDKAKAELKTRISDYINEVNRKQNDNSNNNDDVEPPAKKQKLSWSFLMPKPKQKRNPGSSAAKKELDKYFEHEFTDEEMIESFKNPLTWWCSSRARKLFPNLSVIALNILSIPASSAAVERLFSLAGHILCSKRLKLNTQNVGRICKLNKSFE